MRAFLLGLAIALAAIAAQASPAELEAIGPGVAPAYVYSDELSSLRRVRFRKARGIQSAAPGGAPLVVTEGVRYLWAVGVDGTVRIAPEVRDKNGVEKSGHPLLTQGGAARLAGVMVLRGGVLTIDSDSGRYAYMDSTLTPERLSAAARWIRKVGVVSQANERPKLRTKYVPSVFEREPSSRLDQQDRRRASFAARNGGYLLLPARGQKPSVYPTAVPTTRDRLRWSHKARKRLRAPAPVRVR